MTDYWDRSSPGKQRELRSARLISAELAVADGPSLRIVIKDVSTRGCGARADQTSPVGANVTLLLHGIGLVEGTVAWLEKGRFGIRFNEPIDTKAVLRSAKPSSDFVVKEMHKTVRDGRRPGFGPKS